MKKPTDILFQDEVEPDKTRKPRIDYAFEHMVVRCGIGCLIRDMAMSEEDYVRLHLALYRLIDKERKQNG